MSIENTKPKIYRTARETISITCGLNYVDRMVMLLLKKGYDDLDVSYPKDIDEHILENRLISITGTKTIHYFMYIGEDEL